MQKEENFEERQDNEVEAIKAIFGNAVADVRENDVWKIRRPPEIHIRLYPSHSVNNNEIHVAATLAVKCDHSYPSTAAEVRLLDCKGLNDNVVKAFSLELQGKAHELRGQECMYPLAEVVQHFLYTHNSPAAKSFYEQMLVHQQSEAHKMAETERRSRELSEQRKEMEYLTIEKQVEERRTHILQQERTSRVRFEVEFWLQQDDAEPEPSFATANKDFADSCGRRGSYHTSTSSRSRSRSLEKKPPLSPPACCSMLTGKKEHFIMETRNGKKWKVMLYKSFPRGVGYCFTHYAMDLENHNALMIVNEWIFQWTTIRKKVSAQQAEQLAEESHKYLRQLDGIDMEFQSLLRLNNTGLVKYLGWNYGFRKDHVYTHVLKEFVHGIPLVSFLREGASFSLDQVKLLSKHLLATLRYLHSNNVPHRHIVPSSVFLDNEGKFLLADYAIEKRLEEIAQQCQTAGGELGILQEGMGIMLSKLNGKKADILQFGNLLCAMISGDSLKDELVEVPNFTPVEMNDFLRKCLQSLDKDRWSAEQLLEHRFLGKERNNDGRTTPTEKEKGFYTELQKHLPDDDHVGIASQVATKSLALPTESRLSREFEILEFCGRGGFGDVLKVRNVLDGRTYAIKRIPLNEAREKVNKRILREVQLLSRLNHENIVRYYNSWIESAMPSSSATTEVSSLVTSGVSKSAKKPGGFVNSVGFGLTDDVEGNAPPAVDGSVEWSVTPDDENKEAAPKADISSPVEDTGFFGRSYPHKMEISTDSSEDIEFDRTGGSLREITSSIQELKLETTTAPMTTASAAKSLLPNVVLYIQMEFCEKSTLRSCIDDGVHKDPERVWRLFREVVEGIGHIHQQGVIHRDLKPANIFIDSHEHVRLGDFGLATHILMSRSTFAENLSEMHDLQEQTGDETSRTGRVGTAMYVAPELMENTNKAQYSQKVDMYSLGICFFEMCYRPLPTGMERNKVLVCLRKNPPQFPDDFDLVGLQRQALVIKWLCDHDPRKRPNAVELLQSDLLPPPKIEDAEMNEIIRHTVQNPQSKAYKRLISSLFSQRVDAVTDLTYDLDVQKILGNKRSALAFEYVQVKVTKVFQLHGAVFFGTPLLMPRPDNQTDKESLVSLMDNSGDIVTIPHDLRVPFARYVARNKISNMKRYCIDRVFRGRKITAAHPRELYECAFDVVSTNLDSLLPEAECVAVVNEIIKDFPSLSNKPFRLRINHIDLIRSAFVHAGVVQEKFDLALDWLHTVRSDNLGKLQAKQKFAELVEIKEHSYAFLEKFLESEGSTATILAMVRSNLVKRKGLAGALAKRAVQDCEAFVSFCDKMGLAYPVDICLGLSDKYIRSGIVFHFMYAGDNRGRFSRQEIFAAGGRYSSLVEEFARVGVSKEHRPVAVAGFSVAFEKLIAIVMSSEEFEEKSPVDVLVYALGSSPMLKEQLVLLNWRFWVESRKNTLL